MVPGINPRPPAYEVVPQALEGTLVTAVIMLPASNRDVPGN